MTARSRDSRESSVPLRSRLPDQPTVPPDQPAEHPDSSSSHDRPLTFDLRLVDTTSEITFRRHLLTGLNGEFARIHSDISDLKSDVAVLKTDVSVLKTDVSILKTDVSFLKNEMSYLSTEVINSNARNQNSRICKPVDVIAPIAFVSKHPDGRSQKVHPSRELLPKWLFKFWSVFKLSRRRCKSLVDIHAFYETEGWEYWGAESQAHVNDEGDLLQQNPSLDMAVRRYPDAALRALCSMLGMDPNRIADVMSQWSDHEPARISSRRRERSMSAEEIQSNIAEFFDRMMKRARTTAPQNLPLGRATMSPAARANVSPPWDPLLEKPASDPDPHSEHTEVGWFNGTYSSFERHYPRRIFQDAPRFAKQETGVQRHKEAAQETYQDAEQESKAGTEPEPEPEPEPQGILEVKTDETHQRTDSDTEKVPSDELRQMFEQSYSK